MVLTSNDARAIYEVKHNGKHRDDASTLAQKYGVTAKTVRDIWTHRTWVKATAPSWSLDEAKAYVGRRLCAACREARVCLGDTTSACRACKHVVRRITTLRDKTDSRTPGAGPTAQSGLAATACPDTPCRAWEKIWHRKNSDLNGLLDEALYSL